MSATQVGLVYSVYSLAQAILSPTIWFLINRWGIRASLTIGTAVAGVTIAAFAFVPLVNGSIAFFAASLLLRVANAAGAVIVIVAAFAMIPVSFPNDTEKTFVMLSKSLNFR